MIIMIKAGIGIINDTNAPDASNRYKEAIFAEFKFIALLNAKSVSFVIRIQMCEAVSFWL